MDTSGGDSTSTKVNVPTSNKFQLLSGGENNVDCSDCDKDVIVYKQKNPTLTKQTGGGPPAVSQIKLKKMPPIYVEGELGATVDRLLCKHGVQTFIK